MCRAGRKPKDDDVGIFKKFPGLKANYETLLRAGRDGRLCGAEATEKATGKKVALLCAVSSKDGFFHLVPIGKLLDEDNPYEAYEVTMPEKRSDMVRLKP